MPRKKVIARNAPKAIPTMCQICGNVIDDNPQDDTEKHEHICPICLKVPATFPHLIKPRDQGGTDDRRNLLYLCPGCHALAESFCALRQEILSPELISMLRLGLTAKKDSDYETCAKTLCGKNFLMWIHPKGGSRHIINQFIDGVPNEYIRKEDAVAPQINLPIVYGRDKRHGKRGRPVNNEIETKYLIELTESNGGMSLRQVQKYLIVQGFNVSIEFIRKRIKGIIRPEELRECPKCHAKFKPKDRRQVFCSTPCYIATYRKPGKKIQTEEVTDAIIPATSGAVSSNPTQ
jgi:hypothetical protein